MLFVLSICITRIISYVHTLLRHSFFEAPQILVLQFPSPILFHVVSTELLARSHKAGFRFAEVGVTHLPRQAGTQTGAKFSVILKAFKELFKLYGKIK